jgi:uncharacterized membrane protein YgcG
MTTFKCILAVSLACFIATIVTGCAGTSKWLQSEPASHLPVAISLPKDDKDKVSVADYITVHCVEPSNVYYLDPTSQKKTKQRECLYASVDVSNLITAGVLDSDLTKRLLGTLVNVSDNNCAYFKARAFANRSAMDFEKTLTQDLATAASAGTATVLAPLSAALSGTNLVVGKSVDSFNSTYYINKTFQAMEAAIDGERSRLKALILAREEDKSYAMSDALADFLAYDGACSFRVGLDILASNADSLKTTNAQCATDVQLATTNKRSVYQQKCLQNPSPQQSSGGEKGTGADSAGDSGSGGSHSGGSGNSGSSPQTEH